MTPRLTEGPSSPVPPGCCQPQAPPRAPAMSNGWKDHLGARSSEPLPVVIIGECRPGRGRGCTEPQGLEVRSGQALEPSLCAQCCAQQFIKHHLSNPPENARGKSRVLCRGCAVRVGQGVGGLVLCLCPSCTFPVPACLCDGDAAEACCPAVRSEQMGDRGPLPPGKHQVEPHEMAIFVS